MAHYNIAYTCGHTGRVELYGKMTDRERTINQMQAHACPACMAKKANEDAAANGLPLLTGSDKQIIWANDIRTQFLAIFRELEEKAATAPETKRAELVAAMHDYRARIITQDSSAWISNRYNYDSPRAIIMDMKCKDGGNE